ncbi:inactive protein kinase SELMODRAFT_444075-like [Selaginella moellendorffii]|nr:inactive protein kinase SELMODRAFT_444075-like [Selaginella moellendorffii]|eukprot:XP_002970350.2 inactive protein kinase SELMODRAFT_444075-like [Selaginella moellendorffii]
MGALGVGGAMHSIFSSCSGSVCVTVDDRQERALSNRHQSRSSGVGCSSSRSGNVVLVAMDALSGDGGAVVLQEHALRWAARNVVRSGDCLCVVAIYRRDQGFGRKLWHCDDSRSGDEEFVGCRNRPRPPRHRDPREQRIKDSCTLLASKLCDTSKINLKVKTTPWWRGIVVEEANKLQASWVVLERSLRKEGKWCARGCRSNVVVVSQVGFRVLCLNLKNAAAAIASSSSSSMLGLPSSKKRVIFSTGDGAAAADFEEEASSSPEIETPFSVTERGSSSSSSTSSSEHDRAVGFSCTGGAKKKISTAAATDSVISSDTKKNCLDERLFSQTRSILSDAENYIKCRPGLDSATTPDISERFSALQVESYGKSPRKNARHVSQRSSEGLLPIEEVEAPSVSNQHRNQQPDDHRLLDRTSSVRKAVALPLKRSLAGSPPLCSICQHASPVFGRPPRRFSYSELEFATGGFCNANFLAEGGYGSVHRGVLGDGIPVAVKQYKLASSQGDLEFCSEVEVLSCAQHRNVVMLIGYCIERKRRLLVYEFICNGSLDSHIYGVTKPPLKWSSRHKIAVGAARGLRYLHEECRVGCIVHRDMRPNNILLTHDFEPMVGDFGLARWQPDGDLGVETRVIGTFGYLAPEYAQTGHITEKADVFSFGVVLLELVTGRKAIDISRPRGQQCLTEWARPLLEEQAHHELIDPALVNELNQYEAYCTLFAASLCIQRDAHLRPRMSQVLRMLEGDLNLSRNSSPMRSRLTYSPHSSSKNSVRSMSPAKSRLFPGALDSVVNSFMSAHPIVVCNTKLSHEALKAAYKDKLDSQRPSLEE